MFVKYQTLIYKPNGQRARVKETPDQCQVHLSLPNKDPVPAYATVPAYAIQFYIETPEGLVEDPMVMVAPKGLVEEHFCVPTGRGECNGLVQIIDDLPYKAIGAQTQETIRQLKKGPPRGTGAPIIQHDECVGEGFGGSGTPVEVHEQSTHDGGRVKVEIY